MGFPQVPDFFIFKICYQGDDKIKYYNSVIGTHKNIRFTCQLWIGITFMCKFRFCFIKQGK